MNPRGSINLKELIMKEQRGQQLKIRFFDDTDHEKLKEIAEMEDRSLNYLVNQAIKQFLKNKESAKA
ncbi:hypothetical protein EXE25_18070 [Acinetobacter bouvetii]|uniref:Ribbon-helix-helix protein, CopG family n=2 Tax=Acinetobacter bouvetii TaxID=202951 RepID=A0A4V2DNR1_9GAMM|nr:hypothetical protein EXE25_18070 [Acinetobacter bouvetii]